MDYKSRLQQAAKSGVLHLSHLDLDEIPKDVFTLTNLVRLDVGWNQIQRVPDEIAQLSKLEELWLNNNPVIEMSASLSSCSKLKVLDCRNTDLMTLPRELGRLNELLVLDLRGCDGMKSTILDADNSSPPGDAKGILEYLWRKDQRRQLKNSLEEKLRMGKYRELIDNPDDAEAIKKLVNSTLAEFKDDKDVKDLIRNADRLFPPNPQRANASRIKATFFQLKDENEKKKLAADLELRLRQFYYDSIDPQAVEGMVKGLFSEVTTLDDMKFLIAKVPKLLPENSGDFTLADVDSVRNGVKVNPKVVHERLVALKKSIEEERLGAIEAVFIKLQVHYSDVEPKQVRELTNKVTALFKVSGDLKRLAEDCSMHFPVEFEAADTDPKAIKASFIKAKKMT